jgi:hypothetical protein
MTENHVGDLASLAGVAISLFGFALTLVGIFLSRRAAEQARCAAEEARDSIRLFDAVVDFSMAITILEEVKRLHRVGQWSLLPDRYSAIRKILITLRSSRVDLSEAQLAIIQGALTTLRSIEKAVEKALGNPQSLKASRFNDVLTGDIDGLIATLEELRAVKVA